MVQFTQVELNGLIETISAEAAAASKCSEFAQGLQDQQLRQLCASIGDMHEAHLRLLTNLLGGGVG